MSESAGGLRRRTVTWIAILALIALVCGLDSRQLAAHFAYGQWVSNTLMAIAFVLVYRRAPPRLRGLMKYGVVIGAAGEGLFSLVFGMYEYRLENVPLYVPPGHSLMYAAVYYFVREPLVVKHQRTVAGALLAGSVAYAAFWLVAHEDVYGALCTGLFVLLVARDKHSRMFFVTMFVFVGYLEQVGTRFGCWFWWSHAFDKYTWLPSGNPPSGISVFYFAFDVLCLLAYLTRRKDLRARYKRLRERRRAEPSDGAPGELAAA